MKNYEDGTFLKKCHFSRSAKNGTLGLEKRPKITVKNEVKPNLKKENVGMFATNSV